MPALGLTPRAGSAEAAEDQAGLRIRHNFRTPLLRKSEVVLHRHRSQKTKRAGEALDDKAKGEGRKNSYLESL
jgi:hypothetical protein